jgi:hypothetical protein
MHSACMTILGRALRLVRGLLGDWWARLGRSLWIYLLISLARSRASCCRKIMRGIFLGWGKFRIIRF